MDVIVSEDRSGFTFSLATGRRVFVSRDGAGTVRECLTDGQLRAVADLLAGGPVPTERVRLLRPDGGTVLDVAPESR